MRYAWGVIMYALMALMWTGFTTYGFNTGYAPRIVALIIMIALALFGASMLRYRSWHDVLPYSALWLASIFLLDVILTVPFTGWSLFSDWNLWVGYSLALIVPLFTPLLYRSYIPDQPFNQS